MKRFILKIIIFIMLTEVLFISNVLASSGVECESGNFIYWLEDGEAFIREYTGTDENVVIPREIDGYPVKGVNSIEKSGDWKSMISGTEPKKRERIKTIIISDGIEDIGHLAFKGCISLTEITIPESVSSIGDCAFKDCDSLTEITIPESVSSIGDCVFESCDNLIIANVLNSVLGSGMFFECISLTTVNLNEEITAILSGTFAKCSSLKTITIPANVTKIGFNAFAGCTLLTEVIVPENVIELGYGTFRNCDNLKSIILKNTNTKFEEQPGENPVSGEMSTFSYSHNLSTFYAFKGSQAEEYSLKNSLEFVPVARVEVNGVNVKTDVPPIIKNGRVLIPMRAMFETLGANINWNGETRTVTANTASNSVVMQINNPQMQVNGVAKTLDVAPEILMNRTLVPARAVSESLGATVEWDEARQTVVVTY